MQMFETIINLKPKSQRRPRVTVEGLKNELDVAVPKHRQCLDDAGPRMH
jgi:hypothetical protein